jgi:hypothetical protein
MATTLSPLNKYTLGLAGTFHGPFSIPITAPDLSTAQTIAQSISTALATAVALIAHGNTEAPTMYTAGSQGSTVSAPSGVKFQP